MRTGPHGLEEQRLENRRRVGLYSLGPQREKNREILQGFEKTRIHVKTSIMNDTHPDHDPGPTWPAPRTMWSKADCTPVDGRQNTSTPRPPRFRTRSPGPESQSTFLLYNRPLLMKLLQNRQNSWRLCSVGPRTLTTRVSSTLHNKAGLCLHPLP